MSQSPELTGNLAFTGVYGADCGGCAASARAYDRILLSGALSAGMVENPIRCTIPFVDETTIGDAA
jgi:hypothetical protein